MDPVGIVYSTEMDDYLYVSKFSNEAIWIGQGDCVADAVTELTIRLDRKTAIALANLLNEEAHAD